MAPRYIRPVLIASICVGVFALLIQDWLIAALMVVNSFTMVRLGRRHRS
jgi:hypothetical protein